MSLKSPPTVWRAPVFALCSTLCFAPLAASAALPSAVGLPLQWLPWGVIAVVVPSLLMLCRARSRKKSEAGRVALERAQDEARRFQHMVEGTNAVAWEFDAASRRCTYVSPRAELVLGFPVEAWDQAGFWRENLHPDDRAFVVEFFDAQIELGYDHELEYRMRHADGRTVFVRDMRTLHRSRGGRIDRVRSLLIDLSVHRATEAALEESEARLRSTFDQATVGIAVCALSGRFLRVNKRYCEITGFSEAELLDMELTDLAPAAQREAAQERVSGLLQAGINELNLEDMLQRRDGSAVWVKRSLSVVRSLRREPSQLMEVLTDITQRRQTELELRDKESRLRTIIGSLDEAVVMRDIQGKVVDCNEAAARAYGMSLQHFRHFQLESGEIEFIHEDGRPRDPAGLPPVVALKSGIAQRDTMAFRARDGEVRWMAVKSEPLHDSQGGVYAVISTSRDITERRRTDAELRLAATVFDNSVEAILIADSARKVLRVNRAYTELTGYSADEVVGSASALLGQQRHDESFYAAIWQTAAEQGFWQGELWNTRKGGKVFPEWLSLSAVRDQCGAITHYVAVFSDITERKASEARIAYLAHHDPLTGLPNRTLLQDRLQQALVRATRERNMVALLFLDLDRFKNINDSLGHHAGDLLLQAVAERIRGCVREYDTVCRQGGDEFIIVLQDVSDPKAPSRVADKILLRLSEPFEIEAQQIGTSFSIGIAVFPTDGHDADTLMKNADTAMYNAKAAGRNTYRYFTDTMNANALERLQLENGLRQALERRELMLYFQPQVSLYDGTIVGAEALIRWHHPQLGFIPPNRFIPIAEESGLILPIGDWVIQEACRQARIWHDEGLPAITVAVNLSVLQFRRGDLVGTVRNALAESGHPPELFELELTESLLMDNAEEVMCSIKQLKALGVRLSIDDFGTGYSSLQYLKRLEVDRLKIDQSFVRDVPHDLDDAAIVRAVVQLGASLKLEVIAEGAETAAQVAFLTGEGCLEAQGYYYCPPVTPEVFGRILSGRAIAPRVADDPQARLRELVTRP